MLWCTFETAVIKHSLLAVIGAEVTIGACCVAAQQAAILGGILLPIVHATVFRAALRQCIPSGWGGPVSLWLHCSIPATREPGMHYHCMVYHGAVVCTVACLLVEQRARLQI